MKKLFIILIVFVVLFTGCVTKSHVYFRTDPDDATLLIDGIEIGQTPIETTLSNGVWLEPSITIKKDGYLTLHRSIQKEVKIFNGIMGFTIWWPSLLYSYGPKVNQYYELYPQ